MQPLTKIIIVGGGTAGWMAASAMARIMIPSGLEVILIEAPDIPTVGVGEATIPEIGQFNDMLGFEEEAFLKATQGTYKLGIEFRNWGRIGDSYIHPFGKYGFDMEGINFHHFWRRLAEQSYTSPIDEYCLQIVAAKAEKFSHPYRDLPNSPLNKIQYAFHFDAGLYAKFLRDYATKNGVKRIEGKVVDVLQNAENGFIESLKLEDGQSLDADFFIDCTGFYGLLIEQTLNSGYEDWSHWLPVNSAVAVACENPASPVPYTRATAYDAGWQWRIPLQHRLGNGYVYCDEYLSSEQAEKDLLSRLEGKPISEPKHLRFTTGHRKQVWIKNCLSLGLSAGFMEPLESTSIHLVQTGLSRLMSMYPDKGFNQVEIDYYNKRTLDEYVQIRDFLILHYKATEREDSEFWRYVKHMDVPDRLTEKMNIYKENGRIHREDNELFNQTSWFAVMHGQNLRTKGWHPVANTLSLGEVKSRLEEIHKSVKKSCEFMPNHMEYLNKFMMGG